MKNIFYLPKAMAILLMTRFANTQEVTISKHKHSIDELFVDGNRRVISCKQRATMCRRLNLC